MTDLNRRQLLKRAGQSTTGIGVAGAFSGIATAHHGWHGHLVYTRDYYSCGDIDACSPSTWGRWEWNDSAYTTSMPYSTGDVTVVIHGWNNSHSQARDAFYDVGQELADEGYGGLVVGWSWKSDCGACEWYRLWDCDESFCIAEQIAWWEGIRLAHFIVDWHNNSGNTLRLLSHSLGTRVLLSALHHLYNYYGVTGEWVTSTHTLASAVPWTWPGHDTFYYPLYYNVCHNYNYFNSDDDTLPYYEEYADVGSLGRAGSDTDADPYNYANRNFSAYWGGAHDLGTWMNNAAWSIHADMAQAFDYC